MGLPNFFRSEMYRKLFEVLLKQHRAPMRMICKGEHYRARTIYAPVLMNGGKHIYKRGDIFSKIFSFIYGSIYHPHPRTAPRVYKENKNMLHHVFVSQS